jgi:hypothetical protein
MRRILVDRAREKGRAKRGGDCQRFDQGLGKRARNCSRSID